MNIKDIDIKLLVVFDAVYSERNVGRAAQRLGMSQPAVSSSINRLRYLLNDHLFVRGVGGMKPTPRSIELALPIHDILLKIHSVLEPTNFSPKTASRVFTLAMSDHSTILLLPRLLALLNREAPNIIVRVRPKSNVHLAMQMDAGEIDFAIGVIPKPPPRFEHGVLFHERYVAAMRRDHPLAGAPLRVDDYMRAHHLGVTHAGDTTGFLDKSLAEIGVERTITAAANQYLVAPELLAGTDLILTAFEKLVTRHPAFANLFVTPCPFPMPDIPIAIVWHPVLSNRPAHTWLREQIEFLASDFGNAPGR